MTTYEPMSSNTITLIDGVASEPTATTIASTAIHVAPADGPKAPAPKSVVRELPGLPAVLAGPIVRRAEPTSIHIWICLSTPVSIVATVFTNSDPSAVCGSSGKTSTTTAFCTTDGRLHAALVCVTPSKGATFPLDTVLHYTMDFTSANPVFVGKAAFKTDQLAYGDSKYPALILPSDEANIVVMQTSCRKLHGKGIDAMLAADEYMNSKAQDVTARVQQLVFTGDQIYADDVDASVLRLAQALGPLLVGFDEILEVYHRGKWSTKAGSAIEGGSGEDQRGQLVLAAGFTSDSCNNHLMAFHDFVTMYVLGWSGQMWEFAKSNYGDLVKRLKSTAGPKKLSESVTASLHPEAIQRLMANVPTYMMCDDHDVTDDWNIDGLFQTKVHESALLRRVVLNALASFWLFQAWGNDPLASPDIACQLTAISGHLQHGAPLEKDADTTRAKDAARLADAFLPAPQGGSGQTATYHWRFITPKPASVIMLDTRTQRKFGSSTESKKPAQLMNENALAWLRSALETSWREGLPSIIASPPPVFGYHVMEWLQRVASSSSMEKMDLSLGFYAEDDESWAANQDGYLNLLETLSGPTRDGRERRLVILAGDVHYSCTAVCMFWKGELPTHSTQVLHLTASAAKNHASVSTLTGLEDVNTNSESRIFAGRNDNESTHFVKWSIPMDGGHQTMVKTNSVGVLVIAPKGNPLDPHILNSYLSEDRTTYDGSPDRPGGTNHLWSSMMNEENRVRIPYRKVAL